MNFTALELELLNLWKSQGVEWLYKYKYRVREFQGGDLTNTELFHDLTCGRIFTDLTDLASLNRGATHKDVTVHIDTLIETRKFKINNEEFSI